jgi:hypothetical protein
MQELLALGDQGGGLDADEFEAALQIVETFHVLTAGLGMAAVTIDRLMLDRANGSTTMSDRDAERCATWFDWSMRLPRGLAAKLVAEIEDQQPIRSVDVLRHACRMWDKTRSDRASATRRLDDPPSVVVDIARPSYARTASTGPASPYPARWKTPLPSPHASIAPRPQRAELPTANANPPRSPSTRWRGR